MKTLICGGQMLQPVALQMFRVLVKHGGGSAGRRNVPGDIKGGRQAGTQYG